MCKHLRSFNIKVRAVQNFQVKLELITWKTWAGDRVEIS